MLRGDATVPQRQLEDRSTAGRTRDQPAQALRERLLGRMVVPAETPAPAPPSGQLLEWLRRSLGMDVYAPGFEAALSDRIGPDLFGLSAARDTPDFLRGVDVAALPPELAAPFLRRLSLTRGLTPDAAELRADELRCEPGRTSSVRRPTEHRAWGQENAPLLPETTVIPHLVHGIWLGGPIPEGPFLDNFAVAADRYAGEVDFVVWTDVTRDEVLRVSGRAALTAPEGKPVVGRPALVRRMLDWSTSHGIHVVNVFEVFHRDNPLRLGAPFAAELAKQLPRGFAAASDHLRLELISLFGGAYVDGDNRFDIDSAGNALPGRLPEFFAEVAGSVPGFTLHMLGPGRGVNNDVIVAPAGHPALRLLQEVTRVGYRRSHRQLFGGIERMSRRYAGHRDPLMRFSLVRRTGWSHHKALRILGIGLDDAAMTRANRVISYRSQLSWGPNSSAPGAIEISSQEQAFERTVRAAATLARQLVTREGNLHLTEVAPVIDALPDPGPTWVAVLGLLADLCRRGVIPPVTSITDLRWDDDGSPQAVTLPREAEALLDRGWAETGWLGAELAAPGHPVWLLDESVTPARFQAPPAPTTTAQLTALRARTERITDQNGASVGIWLPTSDREPTIRADAAVVPPGHAGVWLDGRAGAGFAGDLRVHPADLAALLHEHGLSGRPVLLIIRTSNSDPLSSFARMLAAHLRQLVISAIAFEPAQD